MSNNQKTTKIVFQSLLNEDSNSELGSYCSDRPLYENWTMIDPEGNFLCYTNEKKCRWYVNKGLATLVTGKKKTFQLNFQPDTKSTTDPYYRQRLKNRCVVCGERDDLFRNYVVPRKLRILFPKDEISRNHHDVLPLCGDCKDVYNYQRGQWEKELEEQYQIPLPSKTKKLTPDQLVKAKSLKKYDLYAQAFKTALGEDWWWQVTKMYRQQFLDSVQPKFLPPHWNVEFRRPD